MNFNHPYNLLNFVVELCTAPFSCNRRRDVHNKHLLGNTVNLKHDDDEGTSRRHWRPKCWWTFPLHTYFAYYTLSFCLLFCFLIFCKFILRYYFANYQKFRLNYSCSCRRIFLIRLHLWLLFSLRFTVLLFTVPPLHTVPIYRPIIYRPHIYLMLTLFFPLNCTVNRSNTVITVDIKMMDSK
jgi:hypothetical protein